MKWNNNFVKKLIAQLELDSHEQRTWTIHLSIQIYL